MTLCPDIQDRLRDKSLPPLWDQSDGVSTYLDYWLSLSLGRAKLIVCNGKKFTHFRHDFHYEEMEEMNVERMNA